MRNSLILASLTVLLAVVVVVGLGSCSKEVKAEKSVGPLVEKWYKIRVGGKADYTSGGNAQALVIEDELRTIAVQLSRIADALEAQNSPIILYHQLPQVRDDYFILNGGVE